MLRRVPERWMRHLLRQFILKAQLNLWHLNRLVQKILLRPAGQKYRWRRLHQLLPERWMRRLLRQLIQ